MALRPTLVACESAKMLTNNRNFSDFIDANYQAEQIINNELMTRCKSRL
jgi:hypothetical protein